MDNRTTMFERAVRNNAIEHIKQRSSPGYKPTELDISEEIKKIRKKLRILNQ